MSKYNLSNFILYIIYIHLSIPDKIFSVFQESNVTEKIVIKYIIKKYFPPLLFCYSLLFIITYLNILFKKKNRFLSLDAIEIVKNIFYISHYYDTRFYAMRFILYSYNNTKIEESIPCNIVYKNKNLNCKKRIYNNLAEDYTLINILVYFNLIPLYVVLNGHKISIHFNNIKEKTKRNATVCIGKMINFNAHNMLLQLIEAYLHLGVDYFIIYKISCSDKVDKIMNYYIKRGFMEVYQFSNSFDIKYGKYKTYIQRVKLNDCFYRSLYISENLIMTDLDEVLWPSQDENIFKMIDRIENNNKTRSDVYIFQEKIFKRDYVPFFDRYTHNIKDCDIFSYRICCDYTWSFPKLFIRNLERITSVSIHFITGHLKNYTQKRINSKIGYIRHTRRLWPALINLLQGNWTICNADIKERVIQNNVIKMKKYINI